MAPRRQPGRLRRGHGKRTLPPKLVVICEGMTEKVCLDELRSTWRIPSLHVRFVGSGGDPSAVVRRAKEERGRGTEVWVVFDRDEHAHWRDALDRAHALRLGIGVTNPCIELWALLLHQDQTAHIERDVAQRLLRDLHPSYHHERHPCLDLRTVLDHLTKAHGRAEVLITRASEAGEPYGNPTTRFHLLVDRLRELS